MKFLIDAQLPPGLCTGLARLGHDAQHGAEVLPGAVPDRIVADRAIAQGRILLTKDDDFALRFRQEGLRIVWLRIGNASNRVLIAWLESRWPEVEQALSAGERMVEVR